jgi:hypothetical protein
MQWYGDRFQRLTAVDEEAVKTFVRLMHMLAPPSAMLNPRLLMKVLAGLPRGAELPRGPEPLAARTEKAA